MKTILIDGKLHTKLKIYCARRNLKIKYVIEKLVQDIKDDDAKKFKVQLKLPKNVMH